MESAFSVSDLSKSLVEISKKLEENESSSADPILQELKVSDLDSAISLLENEYRIYSSKNFHPIAAQITRCLALTYKIKGNQEKWLKSILLCLSSTYFKFLDASVVEMFETNIENCKNIKINIENIQTPFSFSCGFLKRSVLPSILPSVILKFRSQITSKVKIDSISVQIKHSETGEISSFEILKDIDINNSKTPKSLQEIGPFASGQISIESITMKIGTAEIVFTEFNVIGSRECVVFPFENECSYSAKIADFGIIGAIFPIKILVQNIPDGAILQNTSVEVHNGKDLFSFVNSDDPLSFSSSIESPKSETETDVSLMVADECVLDIIISVDVSFGIVSSKWKKVYQIEFYNAFKPTFQIINQNFNYSVKVPKPILHINDESTLISTFEYNCPGTVTVLNTKVILDENVFTVKNELQPAIFPLELSTGEMFTTTSHVIPHSKTNNKNMGEIEVTFVDKEGTEMVYSTKLPEISILDKTLDIQMNIAPQIEEKKMYTFQLIGRATKVPFAVDIIIDSNDDFLLDGETSKHVVLPQEMGVLLQVNYMAIKTGELKFPTISVLYVSERVTSTIWQNSPSVYAEYSHISPM